MGRIGSLGAAIPYALLGEVTSSLTELVGRRPAPQDARPLTTPALRRARILVADDHEIVRRGLRALLEAAGHEVCAEAATGREAVALAAEKAPHVAVLDVS